MYQTGNFGFTTGNDILGNTPTIGQDILGNSYGINNNGLGSTGRTVTSATGKYVGDLSINNEIITPGGGYGPKIFPNL